MTELPDYDDLPPAPDGGRSAWGLFGEQDQLGLVNLLTPERVAAAAKLVRKGASFPLDAPLGMFSPPLNSNRGNPRHHVIAQPGGIGFDDVWDNVYPQAGSQWDSLAHIGYSRQVYYNGATSDDIVSGRRNTIDRWAEHGMTGRGVLLDMPAAMRALGRPYDPGTTVEFGPEELEVARRMAGVDYRTGDILLLHTGFTGWYADQPDDVRKRLPRELRAPGLAHSEEVCRYLWNAHCAAVASDTFAVEAWPADTSPQAAPFGFIHQMLIGSFGMALGELWWLRDLAEDCAGDGVYEGMLVSVPARAPGGIASAPNATFLK
ncbi:cyclase family protein [Nonomuraea sp. FMUSA5-5]|uniref:Cyclase family protein n=1 Tax=Nonomuraea composti TaxID=2720023 RepID=A0ABX1B510_9ACTN|nr:cyclase family protein [Nonomuraea sp. FMUSA5-5]NJP92501.1 cyclase family protein [Nonomuraea sp. FMUSA5-5]